MSSPERPSSIGEDDARKAFQHSWLHVTEEDRGTFLNAIGANTSHNTASGNIGATPGGHQYPVAEGQDAALDIPHQYPLYHGHIPAPNSSPLGYPPAPGSVNYGGVYPRDFPRISQQPPMHSYAPRVPIIQQRQQRYAPYPPTGLAPYPPTGLAPYPPTGLPRYPPDPRRPTNIMSDAQRALAARDEAPINPSNVRRPSQRALAAIQASPIDPSHVTRASQREFTAEAGEEQKPKPVRLAKVRASKRGKSHCVVPPPGFPTVPLRGDTPHATLLETAQNRPEEFIRLYPNDVWEFYGWIVARGLGRSANFKECFQRYHSYDPYIAGATAWKNSIGKKIASWGKTYFGSLPGWNYQLPKGERLSDWEKPETWMEKGRQKVKWAKDVETSEDPELDKNREEVLVNIARDAIKHCGEEMDNEGDVKDTDNRDSGEKNHQNDVEVPDAGSDEDAPYDSDPNFV